MGRCTELLTSIAVDEVWSLAKTVSLGATRLSNKALLAEIMLITCRKNNSLTHHSFSVESFFYQSDMWPLVPGLCQRCAYPKDSHYSPCSFGKEEDILQNILITGVRSQEVHTGATDLPHLALVAGLRPLWPAHSNLGSGGSLGHHVASTSSAGELIQPLLRQRWERAEQCPE